MASASCCEMTPWWASMAAWALEPRMSWRHMRLSNGSEAPKRSSSPVGAAEKRPAHRGLGASATVLGVALLSLMISPCLCEGSCEKGPPGTLAPGGQTFWLLW